jgi:glycosyltransferase involved in cell wall biosynthesis
MHEAAMRSFPDVPRVGHLHGTELLMLRDIERWEYGERWAERMRGWAHASSRLFVLSDDAKERVPELLGVDAQRVVTAPNGFDPELFDRREVDRIELWRDWLVEEPRGWRPGEEPGSISYSDADLDAFRDGLVLIYVGRYTEVKRIPLLIRAYAKAQERFEKRAPLVILGGYPGEYEGEHPQAVIDETGARDVFLPGWRSHDELANGLNASDVVVLPSVHEQFGQVLVEGMACGLPVIAVNNHGPATIVDDGETGLLVPPDDESAMSEALVEMVNDEKNRLRMGETAYERSRERYSWPALAAKVAEVYRDVVA